jgi:hypothetical protein
MIQRFRRFKFSDKSPLEHHLLFNIIITVTVVCLFNLIQKNRTLIIRYVDKLSADMLHREF